MLNREEYVEQAYFFRILGERLPQNMPLQDLLAQARDEVLSTTKLPLALGFLLTELNHAGTVGTAMARLRHYFTPFQTYLVNEAENERGRFDMRVAVEVLRKEADYRASEPTRPGIFLYQFETLCRNRLRYDHGLLAISEDPAFDDDWRKWIIKVRRQIGMIDFADMVYVCSKHYLLQQAKRGKTTAETDGPVLFGENEGRIALANRHKDPLYLFSALQRQLGYPAVPRPKPREDVSEAIPRIMRRLERLEVRLKLLEDEQRGGIDLQDFYKKHAPPAGGTDAKHE